MRSLAKLTLSLKKAHSSLIEQVKKEEAKKEQVNVSCDVGQTCDIIDESFNNPIVVTPTNTSYSASTSTSSLSDGFTYDASLMVENENLKKEVTSSLTLWLRPMVVRTACLCAWVAKELLST